MITKESNMIEKFFWNITQAISRTLIDQQHRLHQIILVLNSASDHRRQSVYYYRKPLERNAPSGTVEIKINLSVKKNRVLWKMRKNFIANNISYFDRIIFHQEILTNRKYSQTKNNHYLWHTGNEWVLKKKKNVYRNKF